MTTTGLGVTRFLRHQTRAAVMAATASSVPPSHQAHAQSFGTGTGGRAACMSLVSVAVDDGGGTMTAALLFELIGGADASFHASRKIAPAGSRRAGRCVTE